MGVVSNIEQLRSIYNYSKGRAALKVINSLEKHSKNFINLSPFVVYPLKVKMDMLMFPHEEIVSVLLKYRMIKLLLSQIDQVIIGWILLKILFLIHRLVPYFLFLA